MEDRETISRVKIFFVNFIVFSLSTYAVGQDRICDFAVQLGRQAGYILDRPSITLQPVFIIEEISTAMIITPNTGGDSSWTNTK